MHHLHRILVKIAIGAARWLQQPFPLIRFFPQPLRHVLPADGRPVFGSGVQVVHASLQFRTFSQGSGGGSGVPRRTRWARHLAECWGAPLQPVCHCGRVLGCSRGLTYLIWLAAESPQITGELVMRLCRFRTQSGVAVGFYRDDCVVPVLAAARQYAETTHQTLTLPEGDDLLALLPHGMAYEAARKLEGWVQRQGNGLNSQSRVALDQVELLVPIPRPNKLFLLAGNYAKHIEEGGGVAVERAATFPYVFMKPASTTLTSPGRNVVIPALSPAAIDWELELAVVIGQRCRGAVESAALQYVAGYTVINDISNREFHPNPGRRPRENDEFFDWLHGKWHDSFCPCGPCVASAESIVDPQQLAMRLHVNGQLKQDSSTAHQIFPVAAVIEFISSFVTLEPGDLIATGTPAGVGSTSGTYLKPGDKIEAQIDQIGTLVSHVVAQD